MWRTGTAVIERIRSREFDETLSAAEEDDDDDEVEERRRDRNQRKGDWLKFVQEGKLEKVDKFHEYVLAVVAAGNPRFGFDELESYLDNQPYHDSIALNTLSAQLALLLAQPSPTGRHLLAPSSSSSSDGESGDDHGGGQRAQGGRDEKRAKFLQDASLDDDLLTFLDSISRHSPALFSKAKERFKRAAQLEERSRKVNEPDAAAMLEDGAHGEAARWLDFIQRSEKMASRHASPV